MARRFFAPVTVVAIPEAEGGFRLCGVNDTAEAGDVTLETFAAAMDGSSRALATVEGRSATDAAAPLTAVATDALTAGEILAFRWRASNGAAGDDHALAGRYKALALRDPGLAVVAEIRYDRLIVRLTARALALFVTLEADRPGRFSDNALTLLPGQPADIAFTPHDGDPAAVRITTRDLWSSNQPPT
jgi:beta-mannosidase